MNEDVSKKRKMEEMELTTVEDAPNLDISDLRNAVVVQAAGSLRLDIFDLVDTGLESAISGLEMDRDELKKKGPETREEVERSYRDSFEAVIDDPKWKARKISPVLDRLISIYRENLDWFRMEESGEFAVQPDRNIPNFLGGFCVPSKIDPSENRFRMSDDDRMGVCLLPQRAMSSEWRAIRLAENLPLLISMLKRADLGVRIEHRDYEAFMAKLEFANFFSNGRLLPTSRALCKKSYAKLQRGKHLRKEDSQKAQQVFDQFFPGPALSDEETMYRKNFYAELIDYWLAYFENSKDERARLAKFRGLLRRRLGGAGTGSIADKFAG